MLPKHYSLECLLSLIGLLSCLHFSRLGKHCVHGVFSSHPLSVMRVFDIASQFYGFFKTQKILPSFTFKQKYRKKVHPFFTSFLDNLKSLKVIFAWLTLMSALFPYGKILCPWCFSSHPLSLMEKPCTRFPCLGKIIHACLLYSTPSVMKVFGMASQFLSIF